MQITVELLNDNALHLLHDLEKMHILRLIKTANKVKSPVRENAKWVKGFFGSDDDLKKQIKLSKAKSMGISPVYSVSQGLSLSDFSFSKTRKILENVTTSISDELIDERRSAL